MPIGMDRAASYPRRADTISTRIALVGGGAAGIGRATAALLSSAGAHVVIAKSAMKFLRPVRGDIHAICAAPGKAVLAAFKEKFANEGKARITLSVNIMDGGKPAAEFEGQFVAVREK